MPSVSGRTIVVATDSAEFAYRVVDGVVSGSGLVAVGCPDPVAVVAINERGLDSANAFAVDPADLDAWQRIFAHVEQRLGPVDALVVDCDPLLAVDIARLIEAELRSRGFGGVISARGALDGLTVPVVVATGARQVLSAVAELLS